MSGLLAQLVPRIRTPLAFSDVGAVLDTGHRRFAGEGLSACSYAIAAAQLQLEHGAQTVGGVEALWAIWCWNLGNHDATAADRTDATVQVFDTVPEHEVAASGASYQAAHVRRAYQDATDGAEGYWRCLATSFPEAYAALMAEDVDGYVHGLKLRGYFTASERDYDAIEEHLVGAWRGRISETPTSP